MVRATDTNNIHPDFKRSLFRMSNTTTNHIIIAATVRTCNSTTPWTNIRSWMNDIRFLRYFTIFVISIVLSVQRYDPPFLSILNMYEVNKMKIVCQVCGVIGYLQHKDIAWGLDMLAMRMVNQCLNVISKIQSMFQNLWNKKLLTRSAIISLTKTGLNLPPMAEIRGRVA